MKKIISMTLALLMCITCSLAIVGCANPQSEQKEYYTVTYDLNYEGSTPKTVQIKAGTRATRYNATRSGYTLDNWYNTKECSDGDTFDFLQYINKDTTVYAKWTKNAEMVSVTFDANYEGGNVTTITVEEGNTISEASIPDCGKLGMQYKGWYKDSECTEKWNFSTDVVTESMTLYAEYEQDPSVERDEDGNIVFKNVVVNLFVGGNAFGTSGILRKYASDFNQQYSGKIQINVTADNTTLSESAQANYALRYQQIPGANEGITTNYYSAEEVYEFAGIEWEKTEWYEQSSRDSYVNGKLYSVPIAAGVPYIVYNKGLMTKYNVAKAMPADYASFSALLNAAYEGESKTVPSFRSIVTGTNWPFRECVSYASFIQNDADYFVYENGAYVNKWETPEGTIGKSAVTALTNIYNMFGNGGALHGGTTADEYMDNLGIAEVASGKAFMCIANVPESTKTVLAKNTQVGYMPLSGLFAPADSSQKDQIPVHTIGFQFYKAKNVSLTQLAAAAVFADYVSNNSFEYAESGWYPMRKSIVESDSFRNSDNDHVAVLKGIGNPENFRTLDGYENEKYIFNKIAAEQYMVLSGILTEPAGTVDAEYIESEISGLLYDIKNALR